MSDRTGWYWTRTDDGDNDARGGGQIGCSRYSRVNARVAVGVAQLYLTHQSNPSPRTE